MINKTTQYITNPDSIPIDLIGGEETLATALNDKLSVTNVKNYGATGDGVSDDFSEIQSVIDSNENILFDDGVFLISSALEIPSDRNIFIRNATIKLDDNVDTFVFHNSDYVNGNSNIHIYGIGDAVIDCNGLNQDRSSDDYTNFGYHFYRVSDFSVRDVKIVEPMRWTQGLEEVSFGYINNIEVECSGRVNQDGCMVIGPSSDIHIDGLYGTFGDDCCTNHARENPYQGFGSGGNVSRITWENIRINSQTNKDDPGFFDTDVGIIRLASSPTTVVSDITLRNAYRFGDIRVPAIRVGSPADAVGTTPDNIRNIHIDNVHVEGQLGVDGTSGFCFLYQPVRGLKVSNSSARIFGGTDPGTGTYLTSDPQIFNNNDFEAEDIAFSNFTMDCTNSQDELVIQLKRNTFTNVKFSDISIVSDSTTTDGGNTEVVGILLLDAECINCSFNNVSMNNIDRGVRIEGTTDFFPCSFNNIQMNGLLGSHWDVAITDLRGLTVDSLGEESTTGAPASSRWQVGSKVITDGYYIKKIDGTWRLI